MKVKIQTRVEQGTCIFLFEVKVYNTFGTESKKLSESGVACVSVFLRQVLSASTFTTKELIAT